MPQEIDCLLQVLLGLLTLFFWRISHEKFGSGIMVDGSGQSGLGSIYYQIALALLAGIVIGLMVAFAVPPL